MKKAPRRAPARAAAQTKADTGRCSQALAYDESLSSAANTRFAFKRASRRRRDWPSPCSRDLSRSWESLGPFFWRAGAEVSLGVPALLDPDELRVCRRELGWTLFLGLRLFYKMESEFERPRTFGEEHEKPSHDSLVSVCDSRIVRETSLSSSSRAVVAAFLVSRERERERVAFFARQRRARGRESAHRVPVRVQTRPGAPQQRPVIAPRTVAF